MLINNKEHEKWIEYCYLLAKKSRLHGNNAFGAVLVHDNRLIETAENLDTNEFKPFYGHAEWNLVNKVACKYSDEFLNECILYTSTAPCFRCLCSIIALGIKNIVYGVSYNEFYKQNSSHTKFINYEYLFNNYFETDIHLIGPVLEWEGLAILRNDITI